MADGENDSLMWKTLGVLAATRHELAHDGIVGALVYNGPLEVGTFEIQFLEIDALVTCHLLQRLGQAVALNALDLELSLGIEHAVVDEIAIGHRLLVAVQVGRHAIVAAE